MPDLGTPFTDTPDDLDQAYSQLPVPQFEHTAEVFKQAIDPRPFLRFGQHLVLDTFGQDPDDPVTEENPSGAVDYRRDTNYLNDKYGVPGELRFNMPTTEEDAAAQSSMALQKQYRETVFANTRPQPLTDFGAGVAGSLLNPINLPIMAATGGVGDAAIDGGAALLRGIGLMGEERAAPAAVTLLGRVANAGQTTGRYLAAGAIDNAPFAASQALVSNFNGDEYDMGDALRDIAAGAIFHTTTHMAFRGAAAVFRRGGELADPAAPANPDVPPEAQSIGPAFEPNPVPPSGVPDAVENLTETARRGAFVKAVDDLTGDRPVDVGQYVERENNPGDLNHLNEMTAQPDLPSWRPVDQGEAAAVTTRGTEVPVRYGLAELGDLTTSHDDNLAVNPDFPPELQPRDRERAGAQARNYQLESELNPKLLMADVSAAGGAPIISPDGVVESGNGRTIALRRSAARGGDAYARYKAELQAQGHDVTGMQNPVLVRMRTEPMQGAQRAAIARDMNADVTERMSVPEQAVADARSIDDASLSKLDGTPAGRRAFARDFLRKVAGDQANHLVASDGALSKAGEDRVDAALTAKAYGDPRVVEALFETSDSNIKGLGQALRDAAPAWAVLRATIARGQVPAALDVTPSLRSAVDIVRSARDRGVNTGRAIAELLDQTEMFGGGAAVSAETEAMLRLFFRPATAADAPTEAHFSRPLAAAKVAEALKDYARLAGDYQPGPDLFGHEPDASTSRQLLANLTQRFASGDAGDLDLRPPGGSDAAAASGAGSEARAPVIDVRELGGERSGDGGRVSSEGERGVGGEGGDADASAGGELGAKEDGPPVQGSDDGGAGGVADADAEGAGAGLGGENASDRGGEGGGETGRSDRSGAAFIAADPELRALAEDTERLAAAHGLDAGADTPANQDPDKLTDAVQAAASCLLDAADEVFA